MWRDTGSGALATGWRCFVGLFYVGSANFNLMVTFANPQPVYSAFAALAWPLAETLIEGGNTPGNTFGVA